MNNWTRRAGRVSAAAMVAVVFSGCSLEVLNPGAIQDADLNTPELMPVLVSGVSAEYNDIGDMYAFSGARLTDEVAGTGSYTSTQEYRQGIFDWESSEGFWEQAHEAAWAADQAWIRLEEVLEAGANSSPDAARLFALRGFAFQRLGENFCQMVFSVEDWVDRTVAFDSAIANFNRAITIGTAAGASAAQWVTASQAGIAQAHVGRGDWASASSAAAAVTDIAFVDQALYHASANTNQVWNESWGRAEVGVYRTLAQRMHDGADADPRVAYTKCGEWDDLTSAYPDNIPGGVTSTGDCSGQGSGAHQGADGDHAHYRQDKYNERGSDIDRASGVEMRLIQAEAALQGTPDFAEFIGHINAVRAHYGLAALAAPTAMGTLSFPTDETNMTDALQILDRERYATLWMTGRRLFDLDRWDHPFLAGGWIVGSAALANRLRCMPLPKIECQLNPNLADDANGVCSG
ncbi:MAG: RagB/SusD family nutrient uptake outer membrane protein [Gemmatimonadota bacterium]